MIRKIRKLQGQEEGGKTLEEIQKLQVTSKGILTEGRLLRQNDEI